VGVAEQSRSGGLQPWALVVLVIFVCLGCPSYIAYTTYTDKRDRAAFTPVAQAYLDALIAHDRAKGYDLLCGSRRAKIPLDRWSADSNMEPHVMGYRVLKSRVERPTDTGTLYWVDVELRYSDGKTRNISLSMSDERSGWKVCTESGY
jgi:hypothetical protein